MARHHYETLQQVFDDAYRGLHAQGFKQSLANEQTEYQRAVGDATCAYRGFDGKRCAIGHCIPDYLYDSEIEGAAPTTDKHAYPKAYKVFSTLFAGLDGGMLRRLQNAHDAASQPHEMRRYLAEFAERNGLTIPSVEEVA